MDVEIQNTEDKQSMEAIKIWKKCRKCKHRAQNMDDMQKDMLNMDKDVLNRKKIENMENKEKMLNMENMESCAVHVSWSEV